jgi:hypothetical protein
MGNLFGKNLKNFFDKNMKNLFGKNRAACDRWQDWLDAGAPGDAPPQNLQVLSASLSPQDKLHLQECQDCRIAMDAWLVARQSLQTLTHSSTPAPPWFATRVMAAIAGLQEESLRPAAAWSIVPRFASRLAWASAALLLVASTWLYEKPSTRPSAPPSVSATEGLFDTQPPPSTKDDVLTSLAEKNHE